MRSLLFAALLTLVALPAHAQQARVVAACGSMAPFAAGTPGTSAFPTIDVTGKLCLSGGGSGGGTITAGTTPTTGFTAGQLLMSDGSLAQPAGAVTGVSSQYIGTSAQAHRVYNTFTDASNGEWAALDWQTTANVLTIGTQKNGTGTARNVKFVSGAATILDYGVTAAFSWTINGPLIPTVTTYALGSTAKPWQTIVGTTYWSGSTTGVSCAAGTVSTTTMVVTGGIVTHC